MKTQILAAAVLCMVATTVPAFPQGKGGGGGGGSTPPADPAIAVMRLSSKGDEIVVMNTDGTNAKSVYKGLLYLFSQVNFSPDGRSLVFVTRDGGWRIRALDVTVQNGVPSGTNLRTVLDVPEVNLGPVRWSPFGDEIAFDYHGGPTARFPVPGIYTVPPTGGVPTLTFAYPPGLGAMDFDFSPDSSKFVISSNSLPYMVDRATGTHQILGTFPALSDIFGVKWSRAGDRLLFSAHGTAGNYQLYVIDAVPGATPNLVATGVVSASWSPDDTKLALLNSGSTRRVHVYTFATGQLQPISSGRSENFPDWRRF